MTLYTLTVEDAASALRAGHQVRMTVGERSEDPVLVLTLEDGCIISEAIAGWSAGVVEPVCSADSDFLEFYLRGNALEVVPALGQDRGR